MTHATPSPTHSAGDRFDVFLKPGEYFVGDASHLIRTVLGSCVSVALWDPIKRIGAMSHFLLATRGGTSAAGRQPDEWDAKYGDEALSLMLHELAGNGIAAACCQAKVFGGGDMFSSLRGRAGLAVGRRNGEATRSLLQQHGIKVISESLFGKGHRQIVFDVDTGHVWVRQVPPSSDVPALPRGSRA